MSSSGPTDVAMLQQPLDPGSGVCLLTPAGGVGPAAPETFILTLSAARFVCACVLCAIKPCNVSAAEETLEAQPTVPS